MGEIKQNLLVKNMLTQKVCCKKAVCQTGFHQKPVGQHIFFYFPASPTGFLIKTWLANCFFLKKRLYTYMYG